MKKLLVIFSLAFAITACQSNANKTETVNDPTKNPLPTNIIQGTQAGQRPTNNPPHGQPFHDCALPNGAPFPANGGVSQPKAAELPQPKVEMQQPAAPSGSVKLNPAHGQPGHKCELPVGAPLI